MIDHWATDIGAIITPISNSKQNTGWFVGETVQAGQLNLLISDIFKGIDSSVITSHNNISSLINLDLSTVKSNSLHSLEGYGIYKVVKSGTIILFDDELIIHNITLGLHAGYFEIVSPSIDFLEIL